MRAEDLLDKREVCIIGGGFVGLQEAVLFAKNNFLVHIVDKNKIVVDKINSKKKHELHIKEKYILDNWDYVKNMISATRDYSIIKDSKIIIIAVNTPLKVYGEKLIEGLRREEDIEYFIDFSLLNNMVRKLIEHLNTETYINSLVTIYAGGTYERLIKPLIEAGFELGKDIYITYTPERLVPGDDRITPESNRNLGYKDENSKKVGQYLYKGLLKIDVVSARMDLVELSKLYENAFRLLNIAFAQELLTKYGENTVEVIGLSSSKPVGFMAFYPSPYAGGTCLVKDSIMYWYSTGSELIKKALIINENSPRKFAEIICKKINRLGYKRILFYGIGFKPGSPYFINEYLNPIERLIKEMQKICPKISIKRFDPAIMEKSDFKNKEEALKWAEGIVYWNYKDILNIREA